MKPHTSSFGTILQINAQLVGASITGLTAWLTWPPSPDWWSLGVASIGCALACIACLASAIKMMAALASRDRMLARFEGQTKQQKSAELASARALKSAGMIDG